MTIVLSAFRRRGNTYRAQFMDIIALVAIFLKLTLSNAWKTVAYYFCVSGMVKTMKPCHALIGTFKIRARFPALIHFLFILFVCLLYDKYVDMAQLASDQCIDVQDLGSSPRSV